MLWKVPFNSKSPSVQVTVWSLQWRHMMPREWDRGARRRLCTWWRHQMETFFALLALCAVNSPVTGEFPAQRPVTRSLDVFFDLRLNKLLSKQLWGWWSEETPSCPLWHHCIMTWAEIILRKASCVDTFLIHMQYFSYSLVLYIEMWIFSSLCSVETQTMFLVYLDVYIFVLICCSNPDDVPCNGTIFAIKPAVEVLDGIWINFRLSVSS